MTGYGEASVLRDGIQYFLEVRSLNNRYYKASIRLPDEFQGIEAEIDARLRKRLKRGTITIRGSRTEASESAAFEINHNALERYIEQVRLAPSVAGGLVGLDVASLLALPGVLQPPADEERRLREARGVFLELLDRACEALVAMRRTEGEALREDLVGLRDVIAERLDRIADRAPAVVEQYEQRLQARIQSLLAGADLKFEPVEVIREIASYAERTDIAEEVSRLRGHIDQFTQIIDDARDRPIGRTLDFLSQEMLREANTIASKSPDSDISRWTVQIKGAIDRIKEQVQNVE